MIVFTLFTQTAFEPPEGSHSAPGPAVKDGCALLVVLLHSGGESLQPLTGTARIIAKFCALLTFIHSTVVTPSAHIIIIYGCCCWVFMVPNYSKMANLGLRMDCNTFWDIFE